MEELDAKFVDEMSCEKVLDGDFKLCIAWQLAMCPSLYINGDHVSFKMMNGFHIRDFV
jgi:hypothetical protein